MRPLHFSQSYNLVAIMLSAQDAEDLLKGFPPVEFAFAYGSGVVEQGGYNYDHTDPSKMPMLDLILVVDDSEAWHTANRSQNRSHYTPILPIGPKYIAQFQERIQANLWFNAYVPMTRGKLAGRLMKYGVISKQHLLDDLTGWTSLYTAGRLQKPVHVLKGNEAVEAAMKSNLESAVRTSLLMLPEKFEEIDLYLSIASLSYVGDPRMYLGENPKKVCIFAAGSCMRSLKHRTVALTLSFCAYDCIGCESGDADRPALSEALQWTAGCVILGGDHHEGAGCHSLAGRARGPGNQQLHAGTRKTDALFRMALLGTTGAESYNTIAFACCNTTEHFSIEPLGAVLGPASHDPETAFHTVRIRALLSVVVQQI
jgi:hypothetical protein